MAKILITKSLRLLGCSKKSQFLHHTGGKLAEGTEIEVGEPEQYSYDHDTVTALPIVGSNGSLYILSRDVDPEYWMCSGTWIDKTPSVIH